MIKSLNTVFFGLSLYWLDDFKNLFVCHLQMCLDKNVRRGFFHLFKTKITHNLLISRCHHKFNYTMILLENCSREKVLHSQWDHIYCLFITSSFVFDFLFVWFVICDVIVEFRHKLLVEFLLWVSESNFYSSASFHRHIKWISQRILNLIAVIFLIGVDINEVSSLQPSLCDCTHEESIVVSRKSNRQKSTSHVEIRFEFSCHFL